jgi:hypothetical protein
LSGLIARQRQAEPTKCGLPIIPIGLHGSSLITARVCQLGLSWGPVWTSFEQFRKGGNTALEEIPEHGVAPLVGRGTTYRILRDADFQHRIGLAADMKVQEALKRYASTQTTMNVYVQAMPESKRAANGKIVTCRA